jgi:hypothetical protein
MWFGLSLSRHPIESSILDLSGASLTPPHSDTHGDFVEPNKEFAHIVVGFQRFLV